MAISLRFHSPFISQYSQNAFPQLIEMVASARRSIDLCTDDSAVDLLIPQVAQARERGVRVRWVLDFGGASQEAASRAERALRAAGLREERDLRILRLQGVRLSQNLLVIDSRRVAFNTQRWTAESFSLQNATTTTIDSIEAGAGFTAAMDGWWSESETLVRDIGRKGFVPEFIVPIESICVGPEQRLSAYFQPWDGRITLEKRIEVIQQAEETIVFALPSLEDPLLVDALEDQLRAGVQVRGVLDAGRSKARHFDRAPGLRKLAVSGRIRFLRTFARTGNRMADVLEQQLIAVDEATVFTGSQRIDLRRNPGYEIDTALVIDSLPVSRQAIQIVDSLSELARSGGQRFENWLNAERYAYPKSWVPQTQAKGRGRRKAA